ncbi:senescence/dehydration-associated protein-related protein [Artemisia annua]|uniref:Senescence/dehydration-associated protein-related protein n=1 Tax=Artemisia annua TaxID=35608 RepID=A0A2U1MS53_ARTAN|nr:senescence/dehydration-associated protein-related protein [Artemisia annua]
MGCCRARKPRTLSPPRTQPTMPATTTNNYPQPKAAKHETILSIPNCKVCLMDEGEAIELATGDFTLIQLSDDDVLLATIIKINDDLQWPLTKDEPVVKLDPLHYLFSLRVIKEDDPLSYGVTFSDTSRGDFKLLDKFLKEHSCFSTSSSSRKTDLDWKEFAPKVDAYNNFLAKAIAGGTGHIVRGIFTCSNAYTNQVQKGGNMILNQAMEEKNESSRTTTNESNKINDTRKQNGINNSLKSVRNLSKMTENMSKAMLNGVGIATGSVTGPVVRSQAGKTFFSMVPGEVLLASLDAVDTVMDAAEAAQKQAFSATSGAATRMVRERFGESAGEATGHVLATAGHVAGTASNVAKIGKAINPTASVSSCIRKNATKVR